MDLNEFQEKIVEIWESDKDSEDLLLFCCVGMAEEAGECMGKIKRAMRGEGFDRQGYLLELGDLLAYWTMGHYAYTLRKQTQHPLKALDDLRMPLIVPKTLLRHNTELGSECMLLLDELLNPSVNFEWGVVFIYFENIFTAIRGCLSASEINGTLSEVMQLNLDKLYDRKTRLGTFKGSEDSR